MSGPPLTSDPAIYRNILANMTGGVLCLDGAGKVVTFNPAAGAILAMPPDAVVGRSYAELFFEDPGLDELNELVLKAVYEQELTHSLELDLTRAGRSLSLAVSTTLLRGEGGGPPLGVIVMLSDITERRKRRKLKRLFGEYVDPRVVDRLLDEGDALERAADRREMSVAFCDLAGFTGLAETAAAGTLVQFLNLYVAHMTAAVAATGGVTDKIIGDAVMAFWGPPFTEAPHAVAACDCALGQLAALERLREEAGALGLPLAPATLKIRIGIATGEVVVGSIGAAGARSYTVVGDTVNLAARLEAANKELGTSIAVSDATRAAAERDHSFRAMGALPIRGRARKEPVFALEAGD